MTQTAGVSSELRRMQRMALVAGVIGLVLCAVGALLNPTQFFQSYLFAYLFWLGLALGSLGFAMLQHLTGGGWGLVTRRLFESGALTIPLMALLFVPLLPGIPTLYEWARPDVVNNDPLLQQKQPYLNVGFFVVRAVIYFAAWIALALVLNRWSLRQDRQADPWLLRRLRLLSAWGLIIYFLTMTFASFDWAMSLEPHWYSTIYGAIVVMGQALTTLAFMIIMARLLAGREPLAGVIRQQHFHDLGNLLLAFVMLWTYMSFSQFLIIWSGNIPEEVTWYLHRMAGGWQWIAALLLLFHFFVPFGLLLLRSTKLNTGRLAALAGGLLVVHLLAVFWLVMPAFHHEGVHVHWLDVATVVGLGGLWIAAFVWVLSRRPLLAAHDPRLATLHAHQH